MKEPDKPMEKYISASSRTLVCDEVPIELILNGRRLVTFMCTPQDLQELALGHLYTRRLVSDIDDVLALAACRDMRQINVRTKTEVPELDFGLAQVLTSGCGNGGYLLEESIPSLSECLPFKAILSDLKKFTSEMFSRAELYHKSGGVHCAALVVDNRLAVLKEDVGRHNAIDKAIGGGLIQGLPFKRAVLVTTGRLSSDMVLKAVVTGVPIVVSRSIPTTLALQIAEKAALTVVGRIMAQQPIIYTGTQRVTI